MTSKGLPEIPVMVEGVQKWVTGLTPKTTCDDVIHSLLINMDCQAPHEAVFDYALFENWRGIERPLKGRSKFVKLWKDWGGERSNVQLTLRKIDSTVKNDIYGSMKKKQKSKNWFKTKDKNTPVTKSMYDINSAADSTNIHEDSSIMMQNKENLFCAFNCYSKKKAAASKGLKERDSNMRTPFEKPRSILLQQSRPKSIAIPNPGFTTDSITCIYSQEQYVASNNDVVQYSGTASVKKSAIYNSTATLRKDNVYGSSATLRKDNVYGSSATLRKDNVYGSVVSLRKDNVYGSSATLRKDLYSSNSALKKDMNGVYGSTAGLCRDGSSVYGSTATIRKDLGGNYNSSSSIRKDNVYGSSASLRKDSVYGSASSLRRESGYKSSSRYQSVEPIYSTAREPYTDAEHCYEYPNPRTMGRQLPQNPVDWDYDYDRRPDSPVSDNANSDCEQVPDAGDRLSNLLNVVLSQERRIQEQIHRIKRADNQIEQYEVKLHNIRSKEQGKNYLQDTYMKDALGSEIPDEHDVNMYESLVENMADMDDKLAATYSKLEGLSTMIHNESQQILLNDTESGPLESTRIDPAIQRQIDELRHQLQETINMSVVRETEIHELDHFLGNYEQEMKGKQQKLAELVHELSTDKSAPQGNPHKMGVKRQSQESLSADLRKSESTIRSIMSSVTKKPCDDFSEMGIDVGSSCTAVKFNTIGNNNHQCDNEVEKIFHSRQVTPKSNRGQLTPVGTTPLGISVNAIVEYNNETIDLDALCNIGRRQNPAKLFNEVHGFKPINGELINNITDDCKQKTVSNHVVKSSSSSVSLPPVGVETVAKVFGSRLMPDLTISDCSNSKAVTMDTTLIGESMYTTSQVNDTSLWNTQDDGIDVTFSLPPDPKEKPENTYFHSPNKTNALLESTANIDYDSPSVIVAARPPRPANQTAAQKSRVKKKLFHENNIISGKINSNSKNNEQVEKEIKDIMCSLTGDISGSSRLSESGESGVGSLQGEDIANDVSGDSGLSWGSSFVETAV